jgi:hypothetical protein
LPPLVEEAGYGRHETTPHRGHRWRRRPATGLPSLVEEAGYGRLETIGERSRNLFSVDISHSGISLLITPRNVGGR